MKIHGSDPIERLRNLVDQTTSGREKAAETGVSSPGDRIELSAAAREFHAIREAALSSPEIREALVEGLRQRIESGAYEPDARAIARKMLEELGEGLGN